MPLPARTLPREGTCWRIKVFALADEHELIREKGVDQMTFAALYAILVGVFLIWQWAFFLATKQVSQFKTEPAKIICHLLAEFLTVAALVAGGSGVSTDRWRGLQVFLISTGTLLYSVIDSSGRFVQIRNWSMVGVFAVLLYCAHRPAIGCLTMAW